MQIADTVLVDLAFDIDGVADGAAAYESISDFLGVAPDPPKCDELFKMFELLVSKPRVSYWDMPSGPCDHHKHKSECWICNPCKICPPLKWSNLLRPYPRTSKHLTSGIHIKSLKMREYRGKNAIGDDNYEHKVKVLTAKPRSKTGTMCLHNKRRRRCYLCNTCTVCYDASVGHGPANTPEHRQSHIHINNCHISRMSIWT